MALSRECVGKFHGREIILQVSYGAGLKTLNLRLYVASVCVDQRTVSALDVNTHTLRGRVKGPTGVGYPVTACLTLAWFSKPTYTLAVGGKTIHEEKGPWHSL